MASNGRKIERRCSQLSRSALTDQDLPDDGQLVAAALRNPQAYAALVRRYEPALTRYVRRRLGRHAQSAEDVLQDVFIKAYLNLNDYDQSRPFAPWIYRIAHNEAVGFLRKQNAGTQTISGEDVLLIKWLAICIARYQTWTSATGMSSCCVIWKKRATTKLPTSSRCPWEPLQH
jgi:hypothetical protein